LKNMMLSAVASLMAAGVLIGGCMADAGGESEIDAVAAEGPNVGRGEEVGEAKQALIAGTWSSWQALGGATLYGPSIASRGVGKLDAFVLGTDNNIYINRYQNLAWGGWTSLGAPAGITFVSSPDAVSPDANSVSVAARANDNKFYLNTWTAAGWSGWSMLPGTFSNHGPGMSSRGTGLLDVFGSGTDNQSWTTWLSGGTWNCCAALGSPQNAPLASAVSAVSWNSSNVELFVRGSNNSLWTRWWDSASGWNSQGWWNLGGQFLSGFGVASWEPGHLDVFGVGTDSGIWQTQYDAGWSGFTSVGAPPGLTVASEPDAVSWGVGRIDLIVRGSDNQPWVRSFTSSVPGAGGMAIAAGYQHSLAVKSDGTVRAWGWNTFGQLGDGTPTNPTTPAVNPTPGPVVNLAGVVAVDAGYYHSLALKSDGTVWAWGAGNYGQLGDGTTPTARSTPGPVVNLTGVVAAAAGSYHSLALKSDGTVWAWGDWGGDPPVAQLRKGRTTTFSTSSSTPVQVVNLSGVVALAAGEYYSLAVKSDGTVWAWGDNDLGQLGDGTTEPRITPVQVVNLTGVVAVAAGSLHSLALKSDGTVWAWGSNYSGQLGDGTTTDRSTPGPVGNLTGVVALAAGHHHNLAVKSGGTVWAWGDNYYGQLGDGTTTIRSTPGPVENLAGVVAVASDGEHSLALKSDGTVRAWGWNIWGALGDGTTTNRSTPGPVTGL
jgi:alpha-tubulin suppressor-like RCC1 family protein